MCVCVRERERSVEEEVNRKKSEGVFKTTNDGVA